MSARVPRPASRRSSFFVFFGPRHYIRISYDEDVKRLAVLLAAAVCVSSACRKAPSPGMFENLSLPKLDGSQTVSLFACPTRRCLAVYVAPWCPYCRAAIPLIRDLRGVLRERGMESWVIVGLDREPAVREYARSFGGDTLLDLDGAVKAGGVPHFYVVDDRGRLLRHVAGLPPDPRELLAWAIQD